MGFMGLKTLNSFGNMNDLERLLGRLLEISHKQRHAARHATAESVSEGQRRRRFRNSARVSRTTPQAATGSGAAGAAARCSRHAILQNIKWLVMFCLIAQFPKILNFRPPLTPYTMLGRKRVAIVWVEKIEVPDPQCFTTLKRG